MKSRITFGASMGIKFDTYLVDEVTAVGDKSFRDKSRALFADRMKQSSAIMVNHNLKQLRDLSVMQASFWRQGKAMYFDDLEEAIALHEAMLS